jgi:adenylate cyclase
VTKLSAAIPEKPQDVHAEERWRSVLSDGQPKLVRTRHVFRYLPSSSRCKVCNNPFGGVGGRVLGLAGFRRSRKNPSLCTRCYEALPSGAAQVELAVLSAEVRSSTRLAEHVLASDFARLLKEFHGIASRTLLRHGGVIDKLTSEEVIALFLPGISGDQYRRRAVEAGRDLLLAVGYASQPGPWLGLGVAVSAGPAYVGSVGEHAVDFTAIGDAIDLAARMRSFARGGELLVAADADDELVAESPERTLAVRDGQQPLGAFVVRAETRL